MHARENRRLRSERRRRKRRRHFLDLLNTPGGRRTTSLSRTDRSRRSDGTPFSTVRRRPRRVSRFTTSQRRPRVSAGDRDRVYACPGVLVPSTALRKVPNLRLDALERQSKRTVPRLADAGFEVLPGRSSISFARSRGPAAVPVRCRGARRNAATPGDVTLAVAAARGGAGPAGMQCPEVQECLGLVGPSHCLIARSAAGGKLRASGRSTKASPVGPRPGATLGRPICRRPTAELRPHAFAERCAFNRKSTCWRRFLFFFLMSPAGSN